MSYKDPEVRRAYKQRPEVKERNRLYMLARRKTPEGKLYQQKYRQKNKVEFNSRNVIKERKHNIATQGRKNHYRPWTEQEIASLWNVSYTTKELALLLHRTFHAIRSARKRFKIRQPSDYYHNGNRKAQLSL